MPRFHPIDLVARPDDASLLMRGTADPLPGAPGERESSASIRRWDSSAQLKPSDDPEAPG
jgi:hypothetical protein